ncbi:LamG-like jellyroll fold domain-containing protein [Winogradskyella immobilis]|uniref:HYR domain-containing protein n=1 Tax=Winogradskyella immobilis TaxID=2816852 RepID=A0ABS8EQU4_9FLAO|nr:LamG-like jellyroll fold domain-containing protein [Winogradskyella immobilis]MCC1485603.1 HYR domain-containing protein [Winogradskyella immobilis]MCG0017695.1 HYR domain-containing protein [Winogradskyella immobilis]
MVDDGNGNTITVTQDIIINDTQNPIVTNCPTNITANTDNNQCDYTFNPVEPNFNDNCAIDTIVWTMTGATSGNGNNAIGTTNFNTGLTTITYTATDVGGNSVSCSYTITVTDNQNPTVSNCPSNSTFGTSPGQCDYTFNPTEPNFSDNCGIASINWTITGATNDSGSGTIDNRSFNIGTTMVTYTATDSAGNDIMCSYTITIEDNEAPEINCPGNQNINFDSNICQYTLPDYTTLASTSDNCDTNIVVTQSPAPGSIQTGTVTITLTAIDDAGETSQCTFDVIPSDVTPPNAVCQDITVQLGPNGTANIIASDLDNGSNDACGIANFTASQTSFDCSDINYDAATNTFLPIPVTLTVFDNSGNSDTCTVMITVEDRVAPTMQCTDFVVVIDPVTRVATINTSDIDNGSNDACGAVLLSLSQNTFPENPDGSGTQYDANVTLTGQDIYGNISTCIATVTIEPPINVLAIVTGVIVPDDPNDPNNPIPQPPAQLIEATACPGGITEPRNVAFTISEVNPFDLQDPNVSIERWEFSQDNGETWNQVPNPPAGNALSYTFNGLNTDTFVRVLLRIDDPITGDSIIQSSAAAFVRFLPPDEPPIIVSTTALDICLGDDVTVVAESFFDQPAGQFGEGGEFNFAQPDGWRVDGLDGFFPASGNNTTQPTWKEANSNSNREFSGINYDTSDNTKFAMANGIGNTTTLETPVFSTVGLTAAEAILSFDTSFYFCNGGNGFIELSFDSGNTYTQTLTTVEGYNFTSGNTTGVILTKASANRCIGTTSIDGTDASRMHAASINLGQWIGETGLRVRFTFIGSTSSCGEVGNNTFPNPNNENCNRGGRDLASGWAIDNVGFRFAPVDDILEYTDEAGNVIATGTTATVQPITPGVRRYGVTTLVNGCRAENADGTNFFNVNASLAYAGQDITPLANSCGENFVQMRAYDNTVRSRVNFANGAYEDGLYVVPADDANDFNGTGVTGRWSVISSSTTSCGNLLVFSDETDPNAIFNASPGTYTLRWTIQDGSGCSDDVVVIVNDCPTVDFDGQNDHVDFRNNYNLNSDFSIEVWVKPESTNGTSTVFSRKDALNTSNGYDLSIINSRVVFTAGSTSLTTAQTIGTDRWYHLAVTFDGGTYRLYVDGIELVATGGSAPTTTPNNISALLGAMDQRPPNNTPVNYYHGWMDEFKVWNKALTVEHIRQMMNQEIDQLGSDVGGVVIPSKIYGPDTNQDGVEDDLLTWNNLVGYYRMNVVCGDLAPYAGVGPAGRLRNIQSVQPQTAPLPYTSRTNSSWDTDNTWTNFTVWDVPNSNGINGNPIDWNIVRTNHNISTNTRDLTVLGLIIEANELTVTDISDGNQNENNNGVGLSITHYLKLDGSIDLIGESQLVQKRYNVNQTPESILDVTSSGDLERDQQGTTNLFNYNYWSSPVGAINTSANNVPETLAGLLRDGSNTNNPLTIGFTGNFNATGSSNPITLSNRWIFTFENFPTDSYADWVFKGNTISITQGYGFTMKGSGVGAANEGDIITGGNQENDLQNYVFKGKPNNNDILIPITPGYQALVGNPYPSALDSHEFIDDNIPGGNPGSSPSTSGALYLWEHYTSNQTHILREYQGGYAVLNKTGGIPVYVPALISGAGTPSKVPGRYVPVGQGFFVGSIFSTVGNVDATIKFENDQRVFRREATGTSVFFRNSDYKSKNNKEDHKALLRNETANNEISRIRLNFTAHVDGHIRPLLIGFTPDNTATDGIDYGYDARNEYFQNNDAFFIIEDDVYVIQGVGAFDDSKMYPVGVFLSENSDVEFELTDLENFEKGLDVYIYDSVLGTYTNITEENYVVNLEPDYYADRFFLAFRDQNSTLSSDDKILDKSFISYLSNTKEIYIKVPNNDVTEVKLISILGQTVQKWDTNLNQYASDAYRIPVSKLPTGTYVLNVETEDSVISKKIIIK